MTWELVFKSLVVLLFGAAAVKLSHRQSPAWRHLLWQGTFLVLLALPIACRVVSWELPVLPAAPVERSNPSPPAPALPVPAKPYDLCCQMPAKVAEPEMESSFDFEGLVLAVYGFGASVFAFRILIGLVCLWLTARRSVPVLGLVHRSTHSAPHTAMAFGLRRPIVLLPRDSHYWSPSRRRMVVLHELAHVRRRDFATNMAAELACALYWFNPLVWLGARAMRAEAESAADNAVLASGVRASDYASELLKMSAGLAKRSGPMALVGASPMVQPKIESRLAHILSPSVRRRGATRRAILIALAGVLVVVPFLVAARSVLRERSVSERDEALHRIKQVSNATLMYAQDNDDLMPLAKSTAQAYSLVRPYTNDRFHDIQSPTKRGKFVFNTQVANQNWRKIPNASTTPLWTEVLPNQADEFAESFADGHVALGKRERNRVFNYSTELVTSPSGRKEWKVYRDKALVSVEKKTGEPHDQVYLLAQLLSDRTPIVGSSTSPSKVLLFVDFECPACRKADAQVQAALRRNGQYALYCVPFPLEAHPLAVPAAELGEAARRAGKYAAVHNALMQGEKLTPELIQAVARRYRLTSKPTAADRNSVQISFGLGRALNVIGVPSYAIAEDGKVSLLTRSQLMKRLQK